MVDCYLEAAESDCTIDQQEAGLKSKAQSVSCYLRTLYSGGKMHLQMQVHTMHMLRFYHLRGCLHLL